MSLKTVRSLHFKLVNTDLVNNILFSNKQFFGNYVPGWKIHKDKRYNLALKSLQSVRKRHTKAKHPDNQYTL